MLLRRAVLGPKRLQTGLSQRVRPAATIRAHADIVAGVLSKATVALPAPRSRVFVSAVLLVVAKQFPGPELARTIEMQHDTEALAGCDEKCEPRPPEHEAEDA